MAEFKCRADHFVMFETRIFVLEQRVLNSRKQEETMIMLIMGQLKSKVKEDLNE